MSRAGRRWLLAAALAGAAAGGCTSLETKPMQTVDHVDLERFMGDWYVVAHIPTWIERDAYDALESYRLADDGTVKTTFTFHRGGFDGPEKTYRPTGFVREGHGNALWGMQFVWPIKADYRIVYLDDDYRFTVIARSQRDYAWIMARDPAVPEARFAEMRELLVDLGYDTGDLREIPHRAGSGNGDGG